MSGISPRGDTASDAELGLSPALEQDRSDALTAKTVPALVAVVARPDDCVLCGVCADACPSYAITLDEPVVIDWQSCSACGVCVNICPNDALEMSER